MRLYIGRTNGKPSSLDNGHAWLDVYAMVDLCKPGYDTSIYEMTGRGAKKERSEPLVYFFAEDGNTSVQEDRYGDKIQAIPIHKVIEAIQKDAKRSTYRRFHWALTMLEAIAKDDPEAVVALYGY